MAVPSDIAGLQLWLKADAIGGLSDTDPVATWNDSSGVGNNATQGTAGLRPTYRTNQINGLPVVRFDGSDDRLVVPTTGFPTGDAGLTVMTVYKVSTAGGVVFAYGEALGATRRCPHIGAPANTTTRFGTAGDDLDLTHGVSVVGRPQLASFIYTSADDTVSGRENADGLSGSRVLGAAANWSAAVGRLGCYVLDNSFFNGDIAEACLWNSALSEANRKAMEEYFTLKYWPPGGAFRTRRLSVAVQRASQW